MNENTAIQEVKDYVKKMENSKLIVKSAMDVAMQNWLDTVEFLVEKNMANEFLDWLKQKKELGAKTHE